VELIMADFEDRIASWRRELSSAMVDRPDVVDELEDHLRQELETLTRAGKTPDDAWDAAVGALGDAEKLAREFSKASRASWLPTRVAVTVLGGCGLAVGAFLLAAVLRDRFGALLAAHLFTILLGYGAAFALGFSAAAAVVAHATGTFGARQSQAFRRAARLLASTAAAFTLAGIVLGAFWLRANRGHYWGWDAREMGGLCVLGWNCAALACLRRRATLAVVVGVLGNAVVAAGWFGAALIEPPRPQGVPGWFAPVLAGFVISQLTLAAAAAFMPAGCFARRTSGGPGTA
jgi:hypothetical protein